MTLKEYKKKLKVNNLVLSTLFGVTPSTITHWISGHSKPTLRNANRIVKRTHGEVTLKDLGME